METEKNNSRGPLSVDEITRLAERLLATGVVSDTSKHKARYVAAAMDLGITGITPRAICKQLDDDCGIVWCTTCKKWVELGTPNHSTWAFPRTPIH